MNKKTEVIKLKNGEKINLIKIKNPGPSEKKDYIETFRTISKLAGQDPGDHVRDWLDLADLIFVLESKDTSQTIGFSVISIIDNNVLHIASTMLIPQYQKRGIGQIITRKTIEYFFVRRIKSDRSGLLSIFKPFYVLFRTQNPSVYRKIYKRGLAIYPKLNPTQETDEKIIQIASGASKKLWPYAKFDKENFVLRNAYSLHPFLILTPNNVPWSKDEAVNVFFKKVLNLDTASLDALVVVIKINIFDLLKTIK